MAVAAVNAVVRDEQPLSKRIVRGFRAAIEACVGKCMQEAVSQDRATEPRGNQHQKNAARALDHTETACVELRPLGEDIISSAIPAFFIGRNKAGFWVAREASGRTGGIFLLKRSALAFARIESRDMRCAFILPSARFELDVENEGNPLARQMDSLARISARLSGIIARCVLTGSLTVIALTSIIAVQAAFYIYIWRLAG